MTENGNASEKDDVIAKIGLFVLGLIATYVLFGVMIGVMDFSPFPTSRYSSGSFFGNLARGNPTLATSLLTIFGVGLALHFFYWVVSNLMSAFNRDFRIVVPLTIFIYAIISFIHWNDLYGRHFRTPAGMADYQSTPSQIEDNKLIEKFIIGERQGSQKLSLKLQNQDGKNAEITAIMDFESQGVQRDKGFYVIKKTIKLRDRLDSGDAKALSILKLAALQFDNQTSSTYLASRGNALLDTRDHDLYGCYMREKGQCKDGEETFDVEPMKSSDSRCDCIRYSYHAGSARSATALECTVQSPKSCQASYPAIDTIYDSETNIRIIVTRENI